MIDLIGWFKINLKVKGTFSQGELINQSANKVKIKIQQIPIIGDTKYYYYF